MRGWLGVGAARLARVLTARLELRPIAEEDLEALAALDALPEIRAAIDPFGEHIPQDPAAVLVYERRLVGHPGFLAAIEPGLSSSEWAYTRSMPGRAKAPRSSAAAPSVA